MYIDSNGKMINLPINNGKSIVENFIDYAKTSNEEIEQIMLGTSTLLFTQKHNGEFYIAFMVKDSTSLEFGDYSINLSQYDIKTIMEKLNTYHTEVMQLGTDKFIEKHLKEFE